MTCVISLIHDGEVYMGSDSAGTNSWLSQQTRSDPKIYRLKNPMANYLIGFTSSFRMGQVLGLDFEPPLFRPNQELFSYMVTDFIGAVRKKLKDSGFTKIDNNVEEGGCFLVGVQGGVFQVEEDFQVGIPGYSYTAVGCGKDLAFGSLHTTEKYRFELSPEKRIRLALEAAEEFSAGVRRPFRVEKL